MMLVPAANRLRAAFVLLLASTLSVAQPSFPASASGSHSEPAAVPSESASAPPARLSGARYPIRLDKVRRGSAIELHAVNDGHAPVSIIIELTHSKNTGFAPNVIGPNVSHVIAPLSRKLITMAVPLRRGRPMEFTYGIRFSFGDNMAELKPHVYRLPIPDGSRGVLRTFGGLPFSNHYSSSDHAVELVAPVGTNVVAARDGRVFFLRDASAQPGLPPSPIGNYALVLHDDGSWAIYGWLAPGSFKPSLGQSLKAGDPIAVIDKNPDSVDTFAFFAVARNLAGTSVGPVPLTFSTSSQKDINPKTFTGPVSPDLDPKYAPASGSDVWVPPEHLLPVPPVVSVYGDEDMTPAQRQSFYRHRIVEHANAGRDTVSDSSTLAVIVGVSVGLAVVGVIISFFGTFRTPSGSLRDRLWRLVHGGPPVGRIPADLDRLPELDSMLMGSHAPESPASPTSPPPFDPDLDPQSLASSEPSKAPPQRLHDPATLELLRHVNLATPVGLMNSHLVPATLVVPTALPAELLDFVLIRATDATVALVLLTNERSYLAHSLSSANVRHAVLPESPTLEQVKEAVVSALA